VGGIVGSTQSIDLQSCYAVGNVKAAAYKEIYAGGICGLTSLTGSDFYAYTTVSAQGLDPSQGTSYAGGIIGHMSYYDSISNTYAAGNVRAGGSLDNQAGGIAGSINTSGSSPLIEGCNVFLDNLDGGSSANVYTMGKKENTDTGSTDGDVWDAITIIRGGSIYKNSTVNPLSNYIPDSNSDIADFFPAAEFKNPNSIFAADIYPQWDFPGSWKWITGYDFPVLSWQQTPPDISVLDADIGFIWP
jgi:hypothetical protein